MSDPLSLVRAAVVASQPIAHQDGYYIFNMDGGGIKLPDTTQTSFRRSLRGNAYYYTLRDVIFFSDNFDNPVSEYRKRSVELKVAAVVEQDRHPLINYLKGVIETCPQIDQKAVDEYNNSNPPHNRGGVNNHNDIDGASSNVNMLHKDKFYDQRLKNIRRLESNHVFKAKGMNQALGGDTNNNNDEHNHKRKIQDDGSVDENIDDPEFKHFIEMDRQVLEKLRADDIPAHTISTVLNTVGTDFTSVLKLFNDKVLKPKQPAHAKPNPTKKPPSSNDPTVASSNNNTTAKTAVKHYPIIVVPSSLSSIITLMNIKQLLIDGEYNSMENLTQGFAKRAREIFLVRELKSATSTNGANYRPTQRLYKVIDDPSKLSDEEWDKVVAVFASGQLWQFKGWKYDSPISLFTQVLGVHLATDGKVIDPQVQSWNCRILKINLFKQHLNAAVAKEFWLHLDDFIRLKKPHLLNEYLRKP